jgi:hypothetical protein
VLAVGRSSTGRTHPKLRELVRKDLFDFGAAGADLQGYDAGMSEADYTRLTFDLTVGWAQALARRILPPCSSESHRGASRIARCAAERRRHPECSHPASASGEGDE